jgi:3-oxoacyl-[acyl-carrier protein] reductase
MSSHVDGKSTVCRRVVGKVSIVTGTGSGIGRGIAVRLGAEGAIMVVNDVNPVTASETVDIIRHAGGQAEAFPGDVTSSGYVDDLVNTIAARYRASRRNAQ